MKAKAMVDLGAWCPVCGPKAPAPMKRLELHGGYHCDLCGQAFSISIIPSPEYDALTEETYESERKQDSVPESATPSSGSDPDFDSGAKRKRRV